MWPAAPSLPLPLTMSSRYAMSFDVPGGFPEILKTFTREILRSINMDQTCGDTEVQILDWAQRYFSNLAKSSAPRLSQEEIFMLAQKLFAAADVNENGSLDKSEVSAVLEDLAHDLDIRKSAQIEELVNQVMQVADVNEDGTIDYEEFLPIAVDIVQTVVSKVTSEAEQEQRELREVVEKIFDAYDADKSGFLDASEFNAVFTDLTAELGLPSSDASRLSEEILRNVDVNGDGQVQRSEFMPIAMDILQTILEEAEADAADDEAAGGDGDVELIEQAQNILVHGMTEDELTEVLFKIFKDADKDESGALDPDEFVNCLQSTEIGFNQEEIDLMKSSVDLNGDGLVDFQEFAPLAYSLLVEVIAKQIAEEDGGSGEAKVGDAAAGGAASEASGGAKSRAQQLVNDLSDEELEQTLKKIFDGADQDANGVLDYDEFRECLRSANLGFTDELIEYLILEVDANKDGVIDYTEFCPLCYELLLKIIEVEVSKNDVGGGSSEGEKVGNAIADEEAANASENAAEAEDMILGGMSSDEIEGLLFDIFKAADADDSGSLDKDEFAQALLDSDVAIDEAAVKRLMDDIDTDGDGKINYVEFVPVAFEVLTKIVADTIAKEKEQIAEEESVRMDVFREEAEEKLVKGMSNAELTAHFQAIFAAADSDGSGELEYSEFVECLKGSELGFSQEEIDYLGSQADSDSSGTISFAEFAPLAYDLLVEHMAVAIQQEHEAGMEKRSEAANILSRLSKEELEETIMGLFQEADGDASGLIEKAEFAHAMREANIGLKDEEIEALYAKVDTDGDGKVNYQEFAPLCYDILVEVLARQLAAGGEDEVTDM